MATITLYADRINQIPSTIRSLKTNVEAYRGNVDDLRISVVAIDSSICNLDEVIRSLRASSDTQEEKAAALETIAGDTETFIGAVTEIDEEAAEAITSSKEDFYDDYYYLKPDSEKTDWEVWRDNACEWCRDHWKEIAITAVIIIGAIITIVVVIATGGLALVPLLTALGMSAATAATVSMVIGAAAIVFAGLSAIVNVVDVWNPLEGGWKTVRSFLNWGNLICGGLYNIGCIYNSLHGITASQLRTFGEALKNPDFVKALKGAQSFRSLFREFGGMGKNSSMLWSGLKQGQTTATEIATNASRVSLNSVWESVVNNSGLSKEAIAALDAMDPTWSMRSVAYVLESSGGVNAYLGQLTGTVASNGHLIGDVFINYERIVAPLNSHISGLTMMSEAGSAWSATSMFTNIANTFSYGGFVRTFGGVSAVSNTVALLEKLREIVFN